jgi:hypothetical protein
VLEIAILGTLNLIFLADENQADRGGNDDDQATSEQAIEKIG